MSYLEPLYIRPKKPAEQATGQMLQLIIGFFIIGIIGILTNIMSAKVLVITSADINSIADASIKAAIQEGNLHYIKASANIPTYLPLLILSAVISLVVSTILSSFTPSPIIPYGAYFSGRFL